MKKYVVVMLVMAIALTLVASVAGCGSNKNKDSAKQYMTAGDAQMEQAKKAWDNITAAQGKLATATGDQVNAIVADVTTNGEAMRTSLAAAKVEYDNILALDDVQDYKDYATMQEDIIKAYLDLLDAGNALITVYGPQIAAGTVDLMALMQSPELQSIMTMSTTIQKMEKDAKNFQSEKKLTQ